MVRSIVLALEFNANPYKDLDCSEHSEAAITVCQPWSSTPSTLNRASGDDDEDEVQIVQVRQPADMTRLERLLPVRVLFYSGVFGYEPSKRYKAQVPVMRLDRNAYLTPAELVVNKPVTAEVLWLHVQPGSDHTAMADFINGIRRSFMELMLTNATGHHNRLVQTPRTRRWLMREIGRIQLHHYESARMLVKAAVAGQRNGAPAVQELTEPCLVIQELKGLRLDPVMHLHQIHKAQVLMGYTTTWSHDDCLTSHAPEWGPLHMSKSCLMLLQSCAQDLARIILVGRMNILWFTQYQPVVLRFLLSRVASIMRNAACTIRLLPSDMQEDHATFRAIPSEVERVFLLCTPDRTSVSPVGVARVAQLTHDVVLHGGHKIIPVYCGWQRDPHFGDALRLWREHTPKERVYIHGYPMAHRVDPVDELDVPGHRISITFYDTTPRRALSTTPRTRSSSPTAAATPSSSSSLVPASWGWAHSGYMPFTQVMRDVLGSGSCPVPFHRVMLRHASTHPGSVMRTVLVPAESGKALLFSSMFKPTQDGRECWETTTKAQGTRLDRDVLATMEHYLQTTDAFDSTWPVRVLLPSLRVWLSPARARLFFGGVLPRSVPGQDWLNRPRHVRYIGRLLLNMLGQEPGDTALLQLFPEHTESQELFPPGGDDGEEEEEEEKGKGAVSLLSMAHSPDALAKARVLDLFESVREVQERRSSLPPSCIRAQPYCVPVSVADPTWLQPVVQGVAEIDRLHRLLLKHLRVMQLPQPVCVGAEKIPTAYVSVGYVRNSE